MSGSASPLVTQTNLVGNGVVPAAQIDPALQGPRGIAAGAGGAVWVADAGSGEATLYDGDSAFAAAGQTHAITVTAPAGSAPTIPNGIVGNPEPNGFEITAGGMTAASAFLVAGQDGTLSGWAPGVDGGGATVLASTVPGASFTGLTIGSSDGSTDLYAADFANGTVDEFDSSFTEVATFTDDTVPAGFAPFNTQVIGGNLFVSYAMQTPGDPAAPDAATGSGFVDEFGLDGTFEGRIAQGGDLDAPWGLALAPASFAAFAGDLLVGNSGSGTVDAYNLTTDVFAGKLLGADGQPLVIPGLWSLQPGAGGAGGNPDQVYFTAGSANGQAGLFGTLSNNPTVSFAGVTTSQSGGVITADESSAALAAGQPPGTVFNFGSGVAAVHLTDATVSVGPGTDEAFIQRLYQGLLGRGNDTAGIEFFDGLLSSGVSQAVVASDFLNSAEFIADHRGVSGSALVALDYRGLLGRSAAADGASSFWTDLLADGVSPGAVTAGIAASSESQSFLAPATSQVFVPSAPGTLIHQLYETGLGREVDPAALQAFQGEAAAVTPAQLAAQIVSSPEFAAAHAGQSAMALVNSFYQDGLGRPADPFGAAFWTGALTAGASEGSVLLGIATSPEAAAHLTQNLMA